MSDVEYDDKGLRNMIRMLSTGEPVVKVGILGDKNARSGDDTGETNASIGAKHEFGDDGLPIRSFLRAPIAEHFDSYLQKAGGVDQKLTKEAINGKSLMVVMKKLGMLAERIVQDAFDTGGFGKWKPSNMKNKTVHQTLVETQQLRNSISSEVEG